MKKHLTKPDYKFVIDIPDPNFSPQRNSMVIDRTIKKYEAKQAEKIKLFREGMGERSEAVVSWLKHIDRGKSSQIDGYFTPRMLAHLRGADIIDSLRNKPNMISKPSPVYITGDGLVRSKSGGIVGKEVSNVKKKQQHQKELG